MKNFLKALIVELAMAIIIFCMMFGVGFWLNAMFIQ